MAEKVGYGKTRFSFVGCDNNYHGSLGWKYKNGSLRIIAPVFMPNGEELTLYAIYGKKRFSFSLLYRKSQLIRRWDFKRHTNPDGEVINSTHKHYWTPEHDDDWAYPVSDIPLDNINDALLAFLKECNISIEGHYIQILF